mgnify:CR=1 FL=1
MSPDPVVGGAFAMAAVLAGLAPLSSPPGRRVVPRPRRSRATAESPRRRRRRALRILGVSLVGIGAAAVLGALMVSTIVGVGAMLRRLRPRLAERRRRAEMHAALPDAVDLLVLMIRSGLTPHLAVRAMARRAPGPTRDGFDAVVRRVDRGIVLADALDALVAATVPAYAWVADALTTSERHGTPRAPVLDQLALEARRRRRADAEAHARTLPVRLSFPLVVCILPAFVLVAIAPAVMAALSSLGSPPW